MKPNDTPGVRVRAPWPDFGGNPIHAGDTIRHPSGEVGRVVYRPEGATEHDRWKVDYDNGSPLSSLSLQVGGKGMAVVFPHGVSETRDSLHEAIVKEVGAEFHTPHGDGVSGTAPAVDQKCLPDGIRPQILTTLNARQLHQAWQFVNPDAGDADQEESEVSIRWWPGGKNTDGEEAPAGYYAHLTEYPDEGSLYLDPERPIDGVAIPATVTDDRIYALAKEHFGGGAYNLIWQDDPRYAAHCDMPKDARWSASSVRAEQLIAFARALLAESTPGVSASPG